MNNDEMNEEKRDQVSAEMGVRIVAWVSGEASPAEAAELAALVGAKPELAAFKRRIEAMGGLAEEAVSRDREPLRLSEPLRSALLREISAPAKAAAGERTDAAGVPELAAIQRKQRRERQWMLAIAASLTVGLFLSLMSPSRQLSLSAERMSRKDIGSEYLKKERSATEAREPAFAVAMDTVEEQKEVTLSAPQFEVAPEVTMPAMPASVARREARQAPPAAIALPEAPANLLAEAAAQNATRPTGAAPGVPETQGISTFDMGKLKSATLGIAGQLEPAPADFHVAEAKKGNGPGESASAESEDTTVLSPFTVKEPQDNESYKANSTLAGTRVRTGPQDTASSLSVVTAQFLEDTGAKSADDRLGYFPKDEVGGLGVGTTVSTTTATAEPATAEVATSSPEADASKGGGAAGKAKLVGMGSPEGVAVSGQAENIAYSARRWDFAEVSAAKDPVSTFSLHVSDVSFRLAQAALARGEAPDPGRIRPEEFYNAFDYGDPMPAMAEKISCHTEQSADPAVQQRNLLRIAMRVPETGHGANQPLRLTVLLDTSGSMEREDRAAAVQSAMKVLVSLLGKDDRVTLAGFARHPRLLAEQVPGDRAGALLDIIARTPPEGGTNLEEAIRLGSELAVRQFAAGAQNRVVLLTDGAANLGDADPRHLAGLVESLRQKDISFDACGVGAGGIDDSMLEALTRKGSGRYYVLDTPEAADEGFARQLAGALHPAAENVKVQVRFNPARVGNYRLIGFENHRLGKEDFRNDKVAAAALSGGEAAVALYEVEALPQGDGDLGEVYVRFRDTASGAMVERSWTLPYEPKVPAFDRATPTMQLAGVAALLAEKLHGGARANVIRLAQLSGVVNGLRTHYAHDARVRELAAMYEQMRRMRYE